MTFSCNTNKVCFEITHTTDDKISEFKIEGYYRHK